MKIVILDEYPLTEGGLSWEELDKCGEVKVYSGKDHDRDDFNKTIERLEGAEIAFINKVIINKEVIDSLPNLKYIGVLATGYDTVDIEYAKEKEIIVTNIPSYATDAVAQMTFALLLELTNHVAYHNEQVKKGEWGQRNEWCFWDYPLLELKDKTIGIIGYGNIGQKVGEIGKSFGMNILANANHVKKELEDENMKYASLEEIFKNSDVISLNCPLTEDTKGIINADNIKKMKDEVIIINTARGGLIVEEDLTEALKTGKIKAAALDVVSKEPIEDENPLLELENVIITPHISWAPVETRSRLMDIAINNLKGYMNNNIVNEIL